LEAPAQPTLPTPLSILHELALAIAPKDKVDDWPDVMGLGLAENAGEVGQTGAGVGGGITVKVTEQETDPP
jgi:hypothetical protein